uniref:DUF4550 domain-containing protein n=1 Tax=Pipistrellus kuhlii TaxID=59472 RepID=A0A7J7TA54_PIPKU|nr:hypothetical protein mPipKuh1_007153 [Pipistrellus kuhlii]
MALQAWDWDDEDLESMRPISSLGSFCQSISEVGVEEYMARTRATGSESEHLYSSTASSSTLNADVPHVVPCKFIISMAFPGAVGPNRKYTTLAGKRTKRSKVEKPVAMGHRIYHIEYFLLPEDREPKIIDMVVFPSVVKLFTDSGVKTMKPCQEGNKVWVSWTQIFNINMTKELLKKINFHKITLKLWDTTDRISKKLRFYQMKTSTFSEDGGSFDEVKHLISNKKKASEQSLLGKEEWSQAYDPVKPVKVGRPVKSLHVKWKESDMVKRRRRKRKKYQPEDDSAVKLSEHWKQGAFSVQLAIMPLLAGWQTVVSHGSKMSANILDCFLTLKTEVPIMTEEQKQDLNPLIIKIKGVSCLPSQPVPFEELERLCTPVYCKYQFHKSPVHQTEGQPHGHNVSFQDLNVIFLGAMNANDLREYLEGPPMVVEVHDRDRKSEAYSRKPTLFGEDPLDSYLNFQDFVSPQETKNNPFESQNKMWDPYGVARVSFADLLLGHKYLKLAIPIHSCESKPTHHDEDGRSRKVVGFRVPRDPHNGPMPMGNYIDADSMLKLRVDITVPLRAMAETPDLMSTQFGRIVFVFDTKKISLLYSLLQDIIMINAKALDLDSYPLTNIQQILSAFKIRVKIQERLDLDVLTGFHLLDGKIHLLILEGLAEQGLKRLWESHQSRITSAEYGKYKVLYNSQLLFQQRLYADLDTILYHMHLCKPLSQLMKHVALHLRNTVMHKAFQALTRIYCICHYSTTLREVMTRDLLPSSSMIKHLSQEFGLPISLEELTDEKLLDNPPQHTPTLDLRCRKSTLNSEILAHQAKYLHWRNRMILDRKEECRNLIQRNISEACQVNRKPPKLEMKLIRSSIPPTEAVYNYSIQTLNSTELAKKKLYHEMNKEPGRRFTYSQNFLSAMVEPWDSKDEERKAKEKARQAWLTTNGFQVTGLHKSSASDHHLDLLPIGATTQLTEEWRENALFANVMRPVLDRDRWSWDHRHQDFDLYKKPPPFLNLPTLPTRTLATGRKMKESGPVS